MILVITVIAKIIVGFLALIGAFVICEVIAGTD